MAANIRPIEIARTYGGYNDDAYTQHFVEGAGQTYKKGTPLKCTAGKLVASTAATGNIGISLADATGVTSADCPVTMFMPDLLFTINVDGALGAGNAPGTGKPSDFTIGATYDLSKDGITGYWYLTSTQGAGTIANMAQLISYDTEVAAVVNARVTVRILQSTTAWT